MPIKLESLLDQLWEESRLAEHQHTIFLEKGIKRISPYLNSSLFPGAAASQVSLALGVKGFSNTVAGACSTGTDRWDMHSHCIKNDIIDICLVGAAEAPGSPISACIICIINALSTHQ